MKAIRGAICAKENTREAIYQATQRLLQAIVERNGLKPSQIVAAFFTMTPDLNADFPAYAARDMGWTEVSMLGAQESLVPGGLDRAIRVLLLADATGSPRHTYLGRAAAMRPDLTEPGDAAAWDAVERESPSKPGGGAGRLLVVGLGLIGGSVAAAARRAGLYAEIRGYDRDRRTESMAADLGLIDGAGGDLDDEMAEADLVVLALPVGEIVSLLNSIDGSSRFKPGCVVTDVGSTKEEIVAAMNTLPGGVRAVGGHPMAGGTRSGPAAAHADLFSDARWALVETESTDDDAMEKVERLVRAAGARPVILTAAEHDRLVAVTSGMPGLLAVALVRLAAAERAAVGGDRLLVGPGFVGASRLAAGDPSMTAHMLASNAANLRNSIEETIEILRQLARDLDAGPESLSAGLADVRVFRESLIGGAT
jgi:monofunctional chorismate mutase